MIMIGAACAPAPAPVSAPAPAPAAAAPAGGAAQDRAGALLNDYRTVNGIGPLVRVGDLERKAQAHAENVANTVASGGSIFHSNLADGVDPGWRLLGENVASAGSVDQAQVALQDSAGQRENMRKGAFHLGGRG